MQVAEAGVVACVDPGAAAPVATAADGLHLLSVDRHVGVVVAVPLPGARRTDRVHDRLTQDVRQRPAPATQEGERQAVDSYVVVLPEGAGRMQRAQGAFGCGRGIALDG